MTDSVDRKPGSVDTEELKKRLAKYESIPPRKKEKVSDLPRWVKTALLFKELEGNSYKEAAKRMNRAASTLAAYAKSPAAKIWRKEIRDFADDPVEMARAYMRANAFSVTLERIAFLEAAIQAGDYSEGDKIARDLQDRIGITKKNDKAGVSSAQQIVINLPGGGSTAVEPAEVETIEATEVEVNDS